MTDFELTLRRIISSFFSDIAGDNDINVDVFNANISLETQQITKLVADTLLKIVPEKMEKVPRNINFTDQEAAVKGGWNAARDEMLRYVEKELGIKL